MTENPVPARRGPVFDRGVVLRQLRLATGLVLMAYVVSHLVNHAFGLWSLEMLDLVRGGFLAIWRNPPATVLLYGSLILHMAAAIHAVITRASLRAMTWPEILQLGFGLLIPWLLLKHILGTRMAHEVFGVHDSYVYVLMNLWVFNPYAGLMQILALLVTWGHGCIGLHLWLRFKPGYRRYIAYWYGLALLVPALSLAGYIVSGIDVVRLSANARLMERAIASFQLPDQAGIDAIIQIIERATNGYVIAVVAIFALRIGWRLIRDRRRGIAIQYAGGREVMVPSGTTILDASRRSGIPHASVCGGRGRCSTCRVRVGRGFEDLPPASDAELKVLRRVGAPPNVRLACQTRPTHMVEVTPLLPPHQSSIHDARARAEYNHGQERDIVVLFADIRDFTRLSEQRLPYDVVFILNRYFADMGAAIEGAGGRIDKFIGDGIMALFGVDSDFPDGCRSALAAARAMSINLRGLNDSLKNDLEEPLRIGIGVHGGAAIVGELGYRATRGLTAVGDTVNAASRLEGTTKEFGAQLVVSASVAEAAGVDLSAFPAEDVMVKGREERLPVRVIADAGDLTV